MRFQAFSYYVLGMGIGTLLMLAFDDPTLPDWLGVAGVVLALTLGAVLTANDREFRSRGDTGWRRP